MAIVYADNVLPETSGVAENINLGAVGDTVTLPAGVTLKTNKITDAGGNNIVTSDGSGNLTIPSGFQGDEALLTTVTSMPTGAVQFTTGITNTYFLYKFVWSQVTPATDAVRFEFGASANAGASWNPSAYFATYWEQESPEANTSGSIGYGSSYDTHGGATDYQTLLDNAGNDADGTICGILYLFNPSKSGYGAGPYTGNATKGTKAFFTECTGQKENDKVKTAFRCGRIQSTAAIDGIRFQMSSGNIQTGIFKMYGVI